jgi:hypothetical protein
VEEDSRKIKWRREREKEEGWTAQGRGDSEERVSGGGTGGRGSDENEEDLGALCYSKGVC